MGSHRKNDLLNLFSCSVEKKHKATVETGRWVRRLLQWSWRPWLTPVWRRWGAGSSKPPTLFWRSNWEFTGTSLVVQWLRLCTSQGKWVPALVQEDATCRGATKPVHHNYWTWALEPASHNYWAHVPQLLSLRSRAHALQQEKPPQWEARAPQRRVAPARRNKRKPDRKSVV